VRHVRAPNDNGAKLIDPPLECVPTLLEANAACRGRCEYDFGGRRLGPLSAAARQDLLAEARRYTASYRDVEPATASARLFLAGHQPQLFHPGVWFKNFALARLAQNYDAVGVNLIVDSDTIKAASIRVPGGSIDEPIVHNVLFDESGPTIPFEERTILDRDLFESFGRRALEALAPSVPEPALQEFWPLAQARARETNNLGACLAQARHQLEGRWGTSTLEMPQSRVCQLPAFHWFTAHLLANLPRLWEIYNSAVAQYRRTYRLRSANHPVPDLARDGQWLEAPFWLWTAEAPKRRRLFARQVGDRLLITDRAGLEIELPASPEADLGRAVDVLAELPTRGIKLRTRALLTTLFGRLLLSDLFLHGIGGGKYDELTDLLIARFFGLEPPGFMVLSGTLHLPVERPGVTAVDMRQVDQVLREMQFHPEHWLAAAAAGQGAEAETIRHWTAHKWQWIKSAATPSTARQRAKEIRQANAALQPLLSERREEYLAERASMARQLRGEAVWSSRE
ncbi:MAG TPA: hypothetical protein VHY20_00155, partial [Pirellulales bacterium]|nr:hypothetical protein [Pirellulales bacterium]